MTTLPNPPAPTMTSTQRSLDALARIVERADADRRALHELILTLLNERNLETLRSGQGFGELVELVKVHLVALQRRDAADPRPIAELTGAASLGQRMVEAMTGTPAAAAVSGARPEPLVFKLPHPVDPVDAEVDAMLDRHGIGPNSAGANGFNADGSERRPG